MDAIAPDGVVLARGIDHVEADVLYVVDPHDRSIREVHADVRAINAAGVLAGLRPGGGCIEAFLLFPDGSTTSLGSPLATGSTAWCDPRLHHLAGLDDQLRLAATWAHDSGGHAYVWDGAAWRLLPPLESRAVAYGFDGGGHAVGWSVADVDHAVVWRDGAITDLGPGRAYSVNSLGVVAGEQDNVATIWSGREPTPLQLPPGWWWGRARAVADIGDVGGSMSGPGLEHGFLRSNGTLHDFNDLLDSHDLLVTEVEFIARDGTVAGSALDMQGNPQGFVALPSGAPLAPDTSWRDAGQVLARGETAVALAVDERAVYWVGRASRFGGWTLRKVPKTGGEVVTLAEGALSELCEGPLAIGGGHLYFRTWEGYADPRLRRVAVTGGAVTTVGAGAFDFAADDAFLYRRDAGGLVRTPHAGGEPLVLDETPGSGVATDGVDVWYGVTAPSGSTLRSVPRHGGPVRELFAPVSAFRSITSITVGARHVYFEPSIRVARSVNRVARSGGELEWLPRERLARDLHAEGEDLFWARPFLVEGGGPGCLGRTAADASSATCLDAGPFRCSNPVADAAAVYVIRDLDVVRIAR